MVCATACLFALAAAAIAQPSGSGIPFQRIDAIARASLARYATPGVSVAIVHRGALTFAAGFGTRDPRRRIPADARTRYGIGSVTKTIVAALIFRLAEQHRLTLDDPITRWLPQFAGAHGVRVRNLLEQTSGIRDYNDAVFLAGVAPNVLFGHVDREPVLEALAHWPLAFAPGTRFAYSNSNYLLLGSIAERATREPLRLLLHEQIFRPLGMADTALDWPDPHAGDEAAGFTKTPFGPQPIAPWDPELTYSAGGLRSTVVDLARFDAALCAGRLVSRDAFTEMTTRARLAGSTRSEYGAGFYAYAAGGRQVAWHDGTVLGYKAMHLLLPQSCDAVVVLADADYYHAPLVAMQIAQAVFGLPGGSAEPFDPNLPQWEMPIAGLLGALPLVLAQVLRRRRKAAAVFAVCAYLGGSVWLPLGIGIAAAAVLAAAWPHGSGSAARTARSPTAS